MHVQVESHNGACIIKITRYLETYADCRELRNRLHELVESAEHSIVFDFTELEFITGSFCGFLASIYKEAAAKDMDVAIVTPKESHAWQVLLLAGFDKIMDFFPSIAAFWHSRELQPRGANKTKAMARDAKGE